MTSDQQPFACTSRGVSNVFLGSLKDPDPTRIRQGLLCNASLLRFVGRECCLAGVCYPGKRRSLSEAQRLSLRFRVLLRDIPASHRNDLQISAILRRSVRQLLRPRNFRMGRFRLIFDGYSKSSSRAALRLCSVSPTRGVGRMQPSHGQGNKRCLRRQFLGFRTDRANCAVPLESWFAPGSDESPRLERGRCGDRTPFRWSARCESRVVRVGSRSRRRRRGSSSRRLRGACGGCRCFCTLR